MPDLFNIGVQRRIKPLPDLKLAVQLAQSRGSGDSRYMKSCHNELNGVRILSKVPKEGGTPVCNAPFQTILHAGKAVLPKKPGHCRRRSQSVDAELISLIVSFTVLRQIFHASR